MSDNRTVRDASGTSRNIASDELSSGIWADRVRLTSSDGSKDAEVFAANAAVDERLTSYLLSASALMATDPGASAGAKLVPIQCVSTAVPNLRVAVYNGSTALPAMAAVGTAGFQKITDGTNTMPTMDAAARPGFVKVTDGTNTQLSGAVANIVGAATTGALLVTKPGEASATDSIVTGTTTPSAALLAGGSGVKYIVSEIHASLAAAADQAPLLVTLTQDAGGSPVVLWQGVLAALANTSAQISLSGLAICQTVANKALALEVATGTIVSGNYIALSFGACKAS